MSRPIRKRTRSLRRNAAGIFAALGDPTRLALVNELTTGPSRSITELSAGPRMTRQAVTKHLLALERAGIVRRARSGRETRFSFEAAPLHTVRSYLDQVSFQWDQALERLKRFVEEDGDTRASSCAPEAR